MVIPIYTRTILLVRRSYALAPYEPLSKLLVSPLISPIVVPYIILLRSLDYGSYDPDIYFSEAGTSGNPGGHMRVFPK